MSDTRNDSLGDGKPALQLVDAVAEHGDAAGERQEQPRGADLSTFPERLFAADMAAIFRVSVKRIYQLDAAGALLFAENRPRIGRKSWSRERVRAYFAGELAGLTGLRPARKRA